MYQSKRIYLPILVYLNLTVMVQNSFLIHYDVTISTPKVRQEGNDDPGQLAEVNNRALFIWKYRTMAGSWYTDQNNYKRMLFNTLSKMSKMTHREYPNANTEQELSDGQWLDYSQCLTVSYIFNCKKILSPKITEFGQNTRQSYLLLQTGSCHGGK